MTVTGEELRDLERGAVASDCHLMDLNRYIARMKQKGERVPMIRLVLAVAAGFVLWSVLWLGGSALLRSLFAVDVTSGGSISDRRLLLLLLLLAFVASAGAGYLALVIAQAAIIRAALILGLLLLLVGIAVQSQYWTQLPLWYHLTFLILLLPATLLGGWLRLAQF